MDLDFFAPEPLGQIGLFAEDEIALVKEAYIPQIATTITITQPKNQELRTKNSQVIQLPHGAEPRLAERLASLLRQRYPGPVQVVCGVQDSRDPAIETVQQLREAFTWDQAPRYLVRDRDHAFDGWTDSAKAFGIDELLTAPRSPWHQKAR